MNFEELVAFCEEKLEIGDRESYLQAIGAVEFYGKLFPDEKLDVDYWWGTVAEKQFISRICYR